MDAADKAQAQAEWLEQYRHRPARKHFARFTDDCADCGDRIEAERIKAVPTATRCIECENFFQHQKKRYV